MEKSEAAKDQGFGTNHPCVEWAPERRIFFWIQKYTRALVSMLPLKLFTVH